MHLLGRGHRGVPLLGERVGVAHQGKVSALYVLCATCLCVELCLYAVQHGPVFASTRRGEVQLTTKGRVLSDKTLHLVLEQPQLVGRCHVRHAVRRPELCMRNAQAIELLALRLREVSQRRHFFGGGLCQLLLAMFRGVGLSELRGGTLQLLSHGLGGGREGADVHCGDSSRGADGKTLHVDNARRLLSRPQNLEFGGGAQWSFEERGDLQQRLVLNGDAVNGDDLATGGDDEVTSTRSRSLRDDGCDEESLCRISRHNNTESDLRKLLTSPVEEWGGVRHIGGR
mmetsp:Transcript_14628/g.34401  ORF Transcript_14628/g.34401 Transcript_14628/m.34401 type:complete len:285 (-) Transcript_14628:139-993(-)